MGTIYVIISCIIKRDAKVIKIMGLKESYIVDENSMTN